MNSLVVFCAFLAITNAGVITHSVVSPLARTTIVEGPSTSSHVTGPDGSSIVSGNPGGKIVSTEDVGVAEIGYSAPVVSAYAAPIITSPVVGSYNTPLVSGYAAPYLTKTYVAPSLTASGYSLFAKGSDLEGQWIPDINEKLYDDGSYKGEIH